MLAERVVIVKEKMGETVIFGVDFWCFGVEIRLEKGFWAKIGYLQNRLSVYIYVMELIDSHCHLGFEPLAGDIDGVISRSLAAGVNGWVNVGTDIEHSRKAVEQAEQYEGMWATAGIHPHYAKEVTAEKLGELRRIAGSRKVAAIGESGLDYHYDFSGRGEQRRVFIEHLRLAKETGLALIVHCREAFEDVVGILDEHGAGVERIVFHCFGGTAEQAKEVVDKGWYVSFTGVVTFKNADGVRAAAAAVPVERMMVETDCPYMSPVPVRQQKVNEPALMVHTAAKLAEIKEMEAEEFSRVVTGVSKRFFGI